ncbi:Ionotropic receptor 198 [Blattella germanica]|nr:Ionotropic receptor 198 [Blattella germanica]
MFIALIVVYGMLIEVCTCISELDQLFLCIRNITVTYYRENAAVVISLPSESEEDERSTSNLSLNADQWTNEVSYDALIQQQNLNQSIIMSKISTLADVASLSSLVEEKHGNYIILIQYSDNLQSVLSSRIQFLSVIPSWNPRGRFLVVIVLAEAMNTTDILVKDILTTLWQWKLTNVNIILSASDSLNSSSQTIKLYTWFPYSAPNKCSTVQDVVIIDTWSTELYAGFKDNTNIFPVKIVNNLHNCPIKASTFPLEMVSGKMTVHEGSSPKITYSEGWEVEFLELVAEHLNTTLTYLPPPPNNERWGNLEDDGTFTGLLGDLVYNRADMGFAAWPLHPRMLLVVDPTKPYLRDGWVWWVPCAKKIPRWRSIFMVFSTGTWTAVLLWILFAVIIMVLLARNTKGGGIQEWDIYKRVPICLSCILSIVLGVSVAVMPRTQSLRLFFISWVWYCFAMTTVFQAFFITFLINPGLEHQVNTFEEILKSGVSFGYNPLIDAIVSDSESEVRNRRLACNDNNKPPCLDWVAYNRNFSLLLSATFMDYILTRWYLDENGKPLICQAGDTFYGTHYVTYMNKGHPLLEQMNRMITRVIEAGFNAQLMERGMEKQRIQAAAKEREVYSDEYNNLSLDYLQGAFLIHICGVFLSFIAFLGELFGNRFLFDKNIHIAKNYCFAYCSLKRNNRK